MYLQSTIATLKLSIDGLYSLLCILGDATSKLPTFIKNFHTVDVGFWYCIF